MLRSELLPHIYDLSPSEEERKSSGISLPSKFYEYLDLLGRREENGVYHLPDSHFNLPVKRNNPTIWGKLDNSPHQAIVTLKKASRFYQEPFAYADFISIRYVYSGSTHIHTLNSDFYLHANDLCLLSNDFVLSQHLHNEEDIVFTLMFEKDYLLRNVLEDVTGGGLIARFILNYIYGNKHPQNFIIFHGESNDRIRHVIEDMLCEYMDPSIYGKELIETYVKLLLFEMLGCKYDYEENPASRHSYQLAAILTRIDSDYKTLTLDKLASELGYNSSYLSRMIKKSTGMDFKDLILQKRMEQAAILLKNTNLSIHNVMLGCGLANETYFYKKFKEHFNLSPQQYRKENKQV